MKRTLALVPIALFGCSAKLNSVAQAICPPPTLFDYAVCVCENLDHVGQLFAKPGPSGLGSVGVNGSTNMVGYSEASGDWVSWQGFSVVGATIGESLITPGNVSSVGDLKIGNNATVGGDFSCVGSVEVDGTFGIAGDENIVGLTTVGNRAAYAGPTAPPCNCDPDTFFDVVGAVAAAKQATSGQSSWDHVGSTDIHLTGGNYYVSSADVVGRATIHIDGSSSVFVDGSLRSVGAEQWKLAPGATLDLFVAGDVLSVGQLTAGDAANPGGFRLYVGGSGGTTVGAVGLTAFYGSVYAPSSNVSYVGSARIVGSIFAKAILGVGALNIEYGDPVSQPTSCDPPDGGGSGGSGSGGDGTPTFQ